MVPDTVVVPAFDRPEFLRLCLERILAAEMPRPLNIMVRVDNHTDKPGDRDCVSVAASLLAKSATLHSSAVMIEPHGYWGNSKNVLEAYLEAYEFGSEYVFLVEDDVLVAPDFFRWHYAVQKAEPDLFCSVAARQKDVIWNNEFGDSPEDYFLTGVYASLGVCWHRNKLPLILEHAVEENYSGLTGYLDRKFPNSIWLGLNGSQDGMITRVLEASGLRTAFPCRPRCYHAGFYGYNRSQARRLQGTLEERIAELRKVAEDPEFLMAEGYRDCRPEPLEAAPWDGQVRCVKDFLKRG